MYEIHRMLGAQREAEFEKDAQNWRRAKEAGKRQQVAMSTRNSGRRRFLVGVTRRLHAPERWLSLRSIIIRSTLVRRWATLGDRTGMGLGCAASSFGDTRADSVEGKE